MHRVQRIAQQIVPNETAASPAKNPDDIVIVSALRTPMCKGKRGAFKDTPPEELLAAVLKATIDRTRIDVSQIGDINVGNVLLPGGGAVMARMAQFLAGIPETVPLSTVNRQCSSGLQAVANIAAAIKAGLYDIGIAAGVESMSLAEMSDIVDPEKLSQKVFENEKARNCLMPMGITSENVAEMYGVDRLAQDTFAARSHAKAASAQENGWFREEIIPVTTILKDKEGNQKTITVDADDGVRKETTVEGLAKLKPAFKKTGSTTAGNASQVSDGAAAVLLARRSAAQRLGLPIIGRFRTYSVVGVPPEIMGVGPAFAIPAALSKAGLTVNDIDIFEINEAFASQSLYSVNKVGINPEKVNPKGGAIAFGHPLGCTGARQVATLLTELKRRGQKLGVVSMCIGTGMGAAGIFEAE